MAGAVLLAVVLATGIPARAQPAADLLEAAWVGFDVGAFPDYGPTSLAMGDVDGDGDTDAVAGRAYYGSPGLSVLINLGGGVFDRPVYYGTGYNNNIGEVALDDVDGDGDLDVVATIPDVYGQTNLVRVWMNTGDGTLGERQTYVTGPGPVGLVLADFNGDGFRDVATADFGYLGTGTSVSVLLHNGQSGSGAGFGARSSYAVPMGPMHLAVGDVNGDGAPDIVVACAPLGDPTPVLKVLLNDGAGGFSPGAEYAVPAYAYPVVAVADLEGDGDVDVITGRLQQGNPSYGVIEILRNAGDGTFGPLESHRLVDWSEDPWGLACADVTGDGWLDILSANPNGRANEAWHLLPSDGAGGFGEPRRYACSQNTEVVRTADVDDDGDEDVLALAKYSSALAVFNNPGDGDFFVPPQYVVEPLTEGMDAADIDGDGDLDVVTSSGAVSILRNLGDGTFAARETYIPPLNPADIRLRDLNNDGYPDLLMGPDAEYPPYNFATALNNGDGTFGPGTVWIVNSCGQGHIDAFDLDNDGDRDVVLTEEQGCFGGPPPRLFIARNRGDGVFDLLLEVETFVRPVTIHSADLNHDGNLDLAFLQGGYGIGVLPGNGNLTFQAQLISGHAGTGGFVLADLNEDGNLDAAVVDPADSFGTDLVGVCPGNGNGTFGPAWLTTGSSTIEALGIAVDIDVGDLDLDGVGDVIVTNYASNDLGVFVGNGDGTLQPQVRYGPGITPGVSVVGDFTGDGVPDVASVVQLPPCCGSAVVVLRGLSGTGGPAGDFDGDGDVDIADFAFFAACFGGSGIPCAGECCAADLDGDGDVDIADFSTFSANFTGSQ